MTRGETKWRRNKKQKTNKQTNKKTKKNKKKAQAGVQFGQLNTLFIFVFSHSLSFLSFFLFLSFFFFLPPPPFHTTMELKEVLEEDMAKFIIHKPTFSFFQSSFLVCLVVFVFRFCFVCGLGGGLLVGVVVALVVESRKIREGESFFLFFYNNIIWSFRI